MRLRLAGCALLVALVVVGFAEAASPTWNGRWRSTPVGGVHGPLVFTLVQRGSVVTGRFGWWIAGEAGFGGSPCQTSRGGTINGTVRGRVFVGTFRHANAAGTLRLTLTATGRRIMGTSLITSGECANIASAPFEATYVGPLP